MNNSELNQIIQAAIDNGTAKYLTLEDIESLKGKRIITKYFGYRGQDGVSSFIVGDVLSHYELAIRNTDIAFVEDGYKNQAEYWESYMNKSKLDEKKNTLMLLSEEGYQMCINCDINEGLFWCSDSDRYVYFVIAE